MNYIKENYLFYKRNYRFLTNVVLFIGLFIGIVSYIVFMAYPEITEYFFKEMTYSMEQKGFKEEQSKEVIFFKILVHNIKLALLMIILGFVPLLVLPTFTSFATFFALGLVIAFFELKLGNGFELLVYGLLPHVIVEFFGFALAASIGMRLSYIVAKKIFSKKRKEILFFREVYCSFKGFLLLVVPIIVLGSVVECTVSPILSDLFLNFN